MRRAILITLLLLTVTAGIPAGAGDGRAARGRGAAQADLRPTVHPPLPPAGGTYWFAPPAPWKPAGAAASAAAADLGKAIGLITASKAAQALPLIRVTALASTPLQYYAVYVRGLAELQLGRAADARRTFASVRAAQPAGALAERAAWREAEAAQASGEASAAAAIYEALLGSAKVMDPDDILWRAAQAATDANEPARALTAWRRLYYEFPASEGGAAAAAALAPTLRERPSAGSPEFKAELDRSERLFQARRYALAKDGFERLALSSGGELADLVTLRLGACDYFLKKHRNAVARLRQVLDAPGREAEARFYFLSATRELGDHGQYEALARRLVETYPATPWAEDTLNNLASHFLIVNEDADADAAFRELLQAYPASRHAPRAAWKAGWWAYKHGRDADAIAIFERGAAAFPRSDYRPPWLYWAGRSRERAGDAAGAVERYRLVVIDYANSYYGRLAKDRLAALRAAVVPASLASISRWQTAPAPAAPPLPTGDLVAWLTWAGLHDAALDELTFVQKSWGRAPALDATRAWVLHKRGDLRPAITLMRQTYPQFLAAGGDGLPGEIQQVIFPLAFWPLIRQHAAQHGLDPFVVAALVAQESTFDPEARSVANAIGLMQVVPSTGRRWARKLGIKRFSARSLTDPAINVRIGTAYFADQIRRFGGVHYALAGYNAGDHRVSRWMAERPGLPREEFIDDIPFPETQNYVKRILGTAEDYRRLYGASR